MFSSNTFVATFFFFFISSLWSYMLWGMDSILSCTESYEIPTFFNTKFFNTLNSVCKRLGYNFWCFLVYFVHKCLNFFFFQEVNENSLKRLSAYLENLQKPGFKSLKPTQLVFYVRETDQNPSDGQEHFSTSGTFLISHVSLAPLQASFGMSSTCLKVARRPLEWSLVVESNII